MASASSWTRQTLLYRVALLPEVDLYLRPALSVKLGHGAKVVDRDGKQWVDAVEQEDANGHDVFRDRDDTLDEPEPGSFVFFGNLPLHEGSRHVDGKPRLRDARGIAFFGKQVEVLDAAVENVDRVHDTHDSDLWDIELHGTAYDVFRSETDDAR